MNFPARLAERVALAVNHLPVWRGECEVWGLRVSAATFERWLYLRLHRLGRMGRNEHAALGRLVRPGMTVLDVGANLGLYTLLLAKLVGPTGRVVAFEPDPDLFALLLRNIALNKCSNIEAHNQALGSREDRLMLRRLILNSGDNTLGSGGGRQFRQNVEVKVVALDEFLPDLRPDLVKIDVQGWEFEVLLGMEKMLSANHQTQVSFELWPAGLKRAGCSPTDLMQWLHARGLQLHHPESRALLDETAFASLLAQLTGLRHTDLLAFRPHDSKCSL